MSSYPPPGEQDPREYGQQPPGGYPPPGGDPGPAGYGPLDDPLVAVSFGDWWSKVAGVLARSWQSLLIIQLAVVAPVLVLVALVGLIVGTGAVTPQAVEPGALAWLFVSALVIVAVSLLAQGASVHVVVREAVGSPVRAGEALSFGAGRALPLLGWGFLAGILTVIGFILLIVPGLYLLVVFGSALTGVIMFEHRGIGRSIQLANKKFWPMAGRVVSFLLVGIVYNVVVEAIVGAFVAQNSVAFELVVNILTVPLTLATVGVAIVAYAELRHHEDPRVTSHVLAGELRA
ncbi:hypothetical protein GCM10009609_37300 [Pseudonocardia aurantiaca]|uniref:Glycerophosphoryl diester phosphodiesterase membrane domain-containing protein n=1 Tax=Pseudonocardia aurantiaca TaxID=75290 RepID=A0ABW4FLX1_9PSEU